MIRIKIHWFYDYDQEGIEYWPINYYIQHFEEDLESRQNLWGAGAQITLVEIRFHKHARYPYYEKQITHEERRR